MGCGIRCCGWFRRNTFAVSVLLLGIANTFVQNAIAEDVKPVQTVVVRAGRLFDPVARRMLDRPVIVIVGNKISSVSNGNPPSISGATLIDLGDATLLPGFIDTHLHPIGGRGYLPAWEFAAQRHCLLLCRFLSRCGSATRDLLPSCGP